MKLATLLALGLVLAAAPLAAQAARLTEPCERAEVQAAGASPYCFALVQATVAAQPQIGILAAGGNPLIGPVGTRGLRLGVLPRTELSLKVNSVVVHVPDVLGTAPGDDAARFQQDRGIVAPALAGAAAIELFPGIDVAPGVGGIGNLSLVGAATWLPFRLLGVQGFERASPDLSFGGGARLGLLRESFVLPGAAASVMYGHLGRVSFGELDQNDAGEFTFDLANWSSRGAVSKRLLGFGLTAGIGFDHFRSDAAYGFRYRRTALPLVEVEETAEIAGVRLESNRWSAFLGGSYTFLLAHFSIEGGWMQGGQPIPGFEPVAGGFNPRNGTLFGSFGARLTF